MNLTVVVFIQLLIHSLTLKDSDGNYFNSSSEIKTEMHECTSESPGTYIYTILLLGQYLKSPGVQAERGTAVGEAGSPGVTVKINKRRELGSVTVLLLVSVLGANIVRDIAAKDGIAQKVVN